MTELPPDLTSLGDQITQAAESRMRERKRRLALLARLGYTGVAAAVALAIVAPGALGPSDRGLFQLASASTATYTPAACDQPRGATFAAARPCAPPGATDVVLSSLARRYAAR